MENLFIAYAYCNLMFCNFVRKKVYKETVICFVRFSIFEYLDGFFSFLLHF